MFTYSETSKLKFLEIKNLKTYVLSAGDLNKQ